MQPKVKKESKVKQKQKQIQKQIVNIKIGDVKKPVRRRAVRKRKEYLVKQIVQPTKYMYQASGSVPSDFQNIGVSRQQAQVNLLAEQPQIRQPEARQVQEQIQIGSGAEARQNLLGGDFLSPEEVRRQRELRLHRPIEKSLYEVYPNEEEVNFEPAFSGEDIVKGGGGSRTEAARKVRQALQLSRGAGSDVPLQLLIQGIYQNEGQPRRPFPTINQRERLLQAGLPIRGDEDGLARGRKKKDA